MGQTAVACQWKAARRATQLSPPCEGGGQGGWARQPCVRAWETALRVHREASFSPPCEGGARGVGRKTSALSVDSPFARNDVRKRHAIQSDEAAHAQSTSSVDAPSYALLCTQRSPGPPPLTPPSQGGKEEAVSPSVITNTAIP